MVGFIISLDIACLDNSLDSLVRGITRPLSPECRPPRQMCPAGETACVLLALADTVEQIVDVLKYSNGKYVIINRTVYSFTMRPL